MKILAAESDISTVLMVDVLEHKPSELEQTICRLFESLRGPVYRYLIASYGNPYDADDISQEAFLRLYNHLRAGNELDNPRIWVFRVAHNVAMDRFKGKQRLQEMDPAVWDRILQLDDPSPNPEQAVIQQERLESVRKALKALSPQGVQVLHLRAEGLRYREIAEIMDVSTTAVANCVGRAIEKLKAELHV